MPCYGPAAAILLIALTGCRQHPPAPLLTAAAAGDVPALESALAAGADLSQTTRDGLTPLILAARTGGVPAVNLLLRDGANPDRPGGPNGWTPLMHAIHKNRMDTARALLEGGAGVDARARSGETALMMAAGYGYTPIVELLLEHGADPRARTPDGANVLSIAASGVPDLDRFTVGSCQAETIRALKRKDPSLSLPDNLWGKAGKLSLLIAKLRGCQY